MWLPAALVCTHVSTLLAPLPCMLLHVADIYHLTGHPFLHMPLHTHTHTSRPPGSSIRLKGRNMTESEHVKLGAYHTIELEPGRSFNLHKALWDSLDIERIRTATDPQASADLAALLITVREGGVGSSGLWAARVLQCCKDPAAAGLTFCHAAPAYV